MNEIALSAYRPQSRLVTKTTLVPRPRFPVIDAHNHLGQPFGGGWDERPLLPLLGLLDQANIQTYIDLDGGWGEDVLQRHLDHFKEGAPDRFVVFGGVDWQQWPERGDNFGEWAAGRLREQVRWGAQGLKIWKPFGLRVKDPQGNLAPIDDARLDPIWQTAAELKLPVVIHVADPVAFFLPLDATNERWEELSAHPDWHFPSPPYPSFLELMTQFEGLIARHPATTFVGAHVGCYAEDLAWVSSMLDRYPNFYVDISARISELGRQPYSARRFFIQHADRILFGTDMGPDLDAYAIYFRFLETSDEYFAYGTGEIPGQGRWSIYGLFLPDDVLEKVYSLNARRVLNLNGQEGV